MVNPKKHDVGTNKKLRTGFGLLLCIPETYQLKTRGHLSKSGELVGARSSKKEL